jgi:hypothetical protein
VDLALDPEQPETVRRVLEALLTPGADVSPWWRAGIEEALAAADVGQGDATALRRRRLGADRA